MRDKSYWKLFMAAWFPRPHSNVPPSALQIVKLQEGIFSRAYDLSQHDFRAMKTVLNLETISGGSFTIHSTAKDDIWARVRLQVTRICSFFFRGFL